MNRFFYRCCFLSFFITLFFVKTGLAQSVAINTDGSAPAASAILDVKSTLKGLLIPRMSSGERTGIFSPAKGLMVFDNETSTYWFYNGSAWTELNGGGGGGSNYWAGDFSGNIWNTNSGKVTVGSTTPGFGFFTIKPIVGQSAFFISETGNTSSDFLTASISAGSGTTSTRFGSITGNFGGGMTIGNQSNAPMYLRVGSAERITILPSGLVGVGTLIPTNQFEVKTPASTTAYGITHTDGTVRISTLINSFGGGVGTTTNHNLKFFTNGVDQFVISAAGNVGVGGTVPVDKFEVTTLDNNYGILHKTTNVTVGTYINGSAGWFGTKTNHPLYLYANNLAGAALLPNGNFGVGTLGPGAKLQVSTNSNTGFPQILAEELDNDYARIMLKTTNAINSGNNTWSIAAFNSNTRANERMNFYNQATGDLMTITGDGNVGIGTTIPAYKLSVNGVIQSKEVRVETGWADFVFEKEYKLKSLDDVEKYIEANKHLPEIPSAEEIQKNGLAVGEVQTKMMQKIEELTLYIIDMQKQITELKSRLNEKQ